MFQIQDAVSETLLIPLYMRYRESLKPNPIIHDESALRLIPQIDYDFSKFDTAVHSSVGSAIRATYLDNVTKDFIQRHQQPIIVMVGCGLDARHERVGDIKSGKLNLPWLRIPESDFVENPVIQRSVILELKRTYDAAGGKRNFIACVSL